MNKKVVIIGAGITGLACAYELKRRGETDVVVLEASPRFGGKVLSPRSGKLVFEAGPDSFITHKPWALELVRELGLGDALLPTNPQKKAMHVYSRGALRRFPEGLLLMAPTRLRAFLSSDIVPWSAKLRMGLDLVLPAAAPGVEESIGDFARRRFGAEALETIIAPVMAGIHAGDPDKLSLEATFPQFRKMEREHGSVVRALRAKAARRPPPDGKTTMFMTLQGGLEILTRALADTLPDNTIRLDAPVLGVAQEGARLGVKTDKDVFSAEHVICTAPANKSVEMFKPLAPKLSSALAEFEFASTATVSLVYVSEGFPLKLGGFGFVVDRREQTTITGATYSSTKFPGRVPLGTVLIRCFVGGAGRAEGLGLGDDDLVAAVRDDLRLITGLDAVPEQTRVARWPQASPQYNVGHARRVQAVERAVPPGLTLAGATFRGIGLPDCIRGGREAAGAVLAGKHLHVA